MLEQLREDWCNWKSCEQSRRGKREEAGGAGRVQAPGALAGGAGRVQAPGALAGGAGRVQAPGASWARMEKKRHSGTFW